jgi:hypothetical protein
MDSVEIMIKPLFRNEKTILFLIVFLIFFGMSYIPFYDFRNGYSLAPGFFRYLKYLLLLLLLVFIPFWGSRLHPKLFSLALFSTYLTVVLVIKRFSLPGYADGYFQFLLPLLSMSGLFLLNQHFLKRFAIYYTSSAFLCAVISFYFFFNYEAAWLKDDLVSGQVSVSGLLDSSNRFGIFLIVGFWMTTLLKYPRQTLLTLQTILVLSLALTGSLGVVVLFLFTNSFYLVLSLFQRQFAGVVRAIYFIIIFSLISFFIFKDSIVFSDVMKIFTKISMQSGKPFVLSSNSIIDRVSILDSLIVMFQNNNLSQIIFGQNTYSRPDSFIAFVTLNTGVTGLFFIFWQSFVCIKTILGFRHLSKATFNFSIMVFSVVFLSFLYEESSLNYPFWFFLNIVMSFVFYLIDNDKNNLHQATLS